MSRALVTVGGAVEDAARIRRRAKTKSKRYEDELDDSLNPKGKLWDDMRAWIYDCGRRTFPWHVLWEDQNESLKSEFLINLHRKFPQPWKDREPMKYITNVIRQARHRSIRDIQKLGNKAEPGFGCQHRWWQELVELAKHPEKRRYVSKSRRAVEIRIANHKFHRWGRGGQSSFLKKFEKTFGREPTCVEVEKAKFGGWKMLLEWMRTKEQEIEDEEDTDKENCEEEEEDEEGRNDNE